MFSLFKRKKAQLKDFYAEIAEGDQTTQASLGLRDIPIHSIIGSVGRAHELDTQFRSKLRGWSERHQRITALMQQGKPLPPIKLFLLQSSKNAEYYIFDGHHRVAAALQVGFKTINAEVTEVKLIA